jgi:hypothetical protein
MNSRSAALALAGALFMAGCGGSPMRPSPNPGGGNGGGNQQPPPNNPPVIDSVAIQGARAKEPANFGDLGETLAITAKVHDDETAVDQLEYDWTATAGTFRGTGANVTWDAPPSASTPLDVTITLKVVEKYGTPATFQHEVTATARLSLHDSIKEVGDMARQFLVDFSDSSIKDVPFIMRNFQPGCYGTAAETDQVSENRRQFLITSWSVGEPSVRIGFGSIGPYNSQRGDAFAGVPVSWKSMRLSDDVKESVAGTDWVAANYYPDQQQWRLCDSQFEGHNAFGPSFIR